MADEVHELAVAIHAEGTQETQDELDDVSGSFEDTAGDVGESTELLGDFANKFKGAGIIFAGAFGTLVAAVASKMPIIEENAAALDGVLLALGLRMDKVAREDGENLNMTLFELQEAIIMEEDVRALGLAFEALGQVLDGLTPDFLEAITGTILVREGLIKLGEFIQTNGLPTLDDLAGGFQSLGQKARDALGGLDDFITDLGADIISALADDIVNPAIETINEYIRKTNKIFGTNIGTIGTINPTLPFNEGPRFPGAPRGIVADPAGTGGGGSQQVTVTGTLDSETNLDSRSISSETKPFTVRGVLGSGRGARLR